MVSRHVASLDEQVIATVQPGMTNARHHIRLTAPAEVREAVADLGRTEDVKFSPDNRRLAVAGFGKNKIVVFDVDIEPGSVRLSGAIEITSSALHRPHGVCFIDDQTFVVANRGKDSPIFMLPAKRSVHDVVELSPIETIRNDENHLLKWPGSVAVSQVDANVYELLICNNYAHYVTRHVLEKHEHVVLKSHEVLLRERLSVPDGVAVDAERRWIAISNHDTHSVFLYENTPGLRGRTRPDGVLHQLNYPHGVRFTPDGRFILVADAGAPYLNVYAKGKGTWNGARRPFSAIRVLDEALYRQGRYHPTEGGPKGVDLDRAMNVVVTTCTQQGLAFFNLAHVLNNPQIPIDWLKKSVQWRFEWVRDDLRRRRGWK